MGRKRQGRKERGGEMGKRRNGKERARIGAIRHSAAQTADKPGKGRKGKRSVSRGRGKKRESAIGEDG